MAVHRCLEAAEIPHAFGGALALAFYAESRETADIDINVFLPVGCWPKVREALAPLGIDVDVEPKELGGENQVKLAWEQNPIHIFFSSDALHEAMAQEVREVPLDGRAIPVIAPEHLVIRKRLLDRPKDRRDIERILAATAVDQSEVDDWVRRLS
ncbi:MAG TPA: hypothetical protein VFP21_06465 [Solirubrobacterales bacterium]|nr:hypothetical protein [Solirubrobacterales bacterium]